MTEEYDSHELDALDDLMRSEGYRLVAKRIAAVLELETGTITITGRLEGIKEFSEMRERQGFIRGLRCVLQIPGILREEIKHHLRLEAQNALDR